MAIYNLVAVTSECRVMGIICKTWTGTLTNSGNSDQTRRLIRIGTVCKNYRKLRENETVLKVPVQDHFPSLHSEKSTHQRCQYFDFSKLEICPKNTDVPAWKIYFECKLLRPEKLKPILLTPTRTWEETDWRTWVTPYARSTILRMAGHKNQVLFLELLKWRDLGRSNPYVLVNFKAPCYD